MAEIDIKVQEIKEALTKMVAATSEFEGLLNSFKSNSSGMLDDMNSDFMGIARKTLSHINDSMITDLCDSLKNYSDEVNNVLLEFERVDDDLASQVSGK